MPPEIRWHYRFTNLSRAISLLRSALQAGAESLSELEREGVIQRFDYTFELAWNTLKDRLEHDGISLATVTPRSVIREAVQAKVIGEGETWLDMLTDRNLMSHTYDAEKFEAVIRRIRSRYLTILGSLHDRLSCDVREEQ